MSPEPKPGSMPRWLYMLWVERWKAGDPSFREIAQRSGLSRGTVSGIFNSYTRPRQSTLAQIFAVFGVEEEKAREIRIALYAPDLNQEPVAKKFEPLEFRTDTQILADAINNLADAIRGLSLLDRRQER